MLRRLFLVTVGTMLLISTPQPGAAQPSSSKPLVESALAAAPASVAAGAAVSDRPVIQPT